jgi:N-acetylmuramoyl-L-alanine amidase
MRDINMIVVHCSATPEGLPIGAREIDAMHRARGFTMIGYHYVIGINGKLETGRALDRVGAHVSGHNANSIGICLVGGLGHDRKPKDTKTPAQEAELHALLVKLQGMFPHAKICGHRDLSPDTDHDGKVERHEWIKECPCFDVADWLVARGISITTH